jgi:hypothetical protein
MDLYLTFYNFPPERGFLSIKNAFSFGRDKKPEDMDLFFNTDDKNILIQIQDSIDKYKPNRVWASFTFSSEFLKVYKIIDKKWIIGGSHIASNKGNKEFYSLFKELPIFVYGTMETYLGKDISSDFDPYFLDFINNSYPNYNIIYSISLGNTCYWKKCKFCKFKVFENNYCELFERSNVEEIIKKSISNDNFIGHTCISATKPEALKKIINSNKNKSKILMYVRADKSILNQIKQFDDLSCYTFGIGLEGLAQEIIDELNKGFKLTVALELIEEIINRGGKISLYLMMDYTFLTKEIVNECKETINRLKYINKKIGNISILCGSIIWNDRENAEKYGYKSEKVKSYDLINRYHSIIPENSEQYNLNNEIIDELNQTSMKKVYIKHHLNVLIN